MEEDTEKEMDPRLVSIISLMAEIAVERHLNQSASNRSASDKPISRKRGKTKPFSFPL